MRQALGLARRNLGQCWPNPAVGSLVVKNGQVVGAGWTARGGRPHAETQALAQASTETRGATLYVTLEPCAHHGKTPPCTDAIIKAGIGRVVVACDDPHTHVNGKGIAALKQASIEVVENVERARAEQLNAGFLSVVRRGRPYVAMKLATSLDSKIAYSLSSPRTRGSQASALAAKDPRSPLRSGGDDRNNIQWITGEAARAYGHLLRSEHDALLTGIGTVLADDPLFTCRLPGLEERSPVRVVLDRKDRLPKDSKLQKSTGTAPLWVENEADDLAIVLKRLAEKGITRVLAEAGATVNTALLKARLVDRIYWFRSPDPIGDDGLSAFDGEFSGWQREDTLFFPPDQLEIYTCSPV